jgi:hypothetical protein
MHTAIAPAGLRPDGADVEYLSGKHYVGMSTVDGCQQKYYHGDCELYEPHRALLL